MIRPARTGILTLIPLSLVAATPAEAERALATHDTTAAIAITEEICRSHGSLDQEWGAAQWIRARAELMAGDTSRALARLRRLRETQSVADDIRRSAAIAEIEHTRDIPERIGLAQKFLSLQGGLAQSTSVWRLATLDLERHYDSARALAFLKTRPGTLRSQTAADAPLRAEELRLQRQLAAPRPPPARDTLAAAARAYAAGDFAAAEKGYGDATGPSHDAATRMKAFTRQMECREALLQGESAARAATLGLSGLPAAGFPPADRITLARIRFEHLGDVGVSEPLVATALADLPVDHPERENARWLLARILARRKAPRTEIQAVLQESPLVRDCPLPPDSPLHPLARLLTYAAGDAAWLAADLGSPLSAPAHPLSRAADACFAATRFPDAARLYSQYLRTSGIARDARAYATLQRARALARTGKPAEALADYRRFVTDKDLARSPLALPARLRAGVLCAGPLDDLPDALRWYEEIQRTDPQSAEARIAAAYRIALLQSHRPAAAPDAMRAFIKTYPGDPISRRYETTLRPRPSSKKP